MKNTIYSVWRKLERIIDDREMTIYQLSKVTGIGVGVFYNLKSGRKNDIKLRTAIKIADTLGISLDELR